MGKALSSCRKISPETVIVSPTGFTKSSVPFEEEIREVRESFVQGRKMRERLKELDLFVLDYSIRESTVHKIAGHTVNDKWKIYNEVKKCGFKYVVVAAFSHMTRVDDSFVGELVTNGEDVDNFFAFTEIIESIKDGIPDVAAIPVGLKKMAMLGLVNPILEVDLASSSIEWERFTVQNMCHLLRERIQWIRRNLSADANIMINLHDFPDAMSEQMERVFNVLDYLGAMKPRERPFGMMFEDSTGRYLPEEVGKWTAVVRKIMDSRGWCGHLLGHVHEKWGFGDMTQIECLANGANGIWASLCREGSALGHACSTVTLMNLIRMGNKKVLERYNCTKLRSAATNVTMITTGLPPHSKQIIYGERALDLTSFKSGGITGYTNGDTDLDLAKFFGEKPSVRISTMSTADMIVRRLVDVFGEDPQFTLEVGERMIQVMLDDLRDNRKEEYMSLANITVLFSRSGGHMTKTMAEIIGKEDVGSEHLKGLIAKVRDIWNEMTLKEGNHKENQMEFQSFYNGFMTPYFDCFKCDETTKALQEIDMNYDGYVDWTAFQVYLKWAMHQYPNIQNTDELLSVVFRKGIITAMHEDFK